MGFMIFFKIGNKGKGKGKVRNIVGFPDSLIFHFNFSANNLNIADGKQQGWNGLFFWWFGAFFSGFFRRSEKLKT